MALLFSLTAFAVFAFLGTFFIALDDTDTRIYNNEAFRNGNDRRIVVIREDGAPFTEEDYKKLLTLQWAESVQRYDNLLDVNYYYRPDVDFVYRYTGNSKDMYSNVVYSASPLFQNHALYAQTVPVLKEGVEFLTAGRLPEHMDEAVAAGGEELLGTTVPVYLLDHSEWGEDSFLYQEMTIVGVTDYGRGLYFEDRIGQMLWQYISCREIVGNTIYGVDKSLTGDEMLLTGEMVQRFGRYKNTPEQIQIPMFDFHTKENILLHCIGTNQSKFIGYIAMSEEMFDRLSFADSCTQVSLFLTDYSYTDRAIRAIEGLGYEAISPYRVGSIAKNEAKAKERMTTLVLCLTALLTVIAAQVVVFTAMFGTQMQGYTQLCNMGLACRIGQRSVFWQMFLFAAAGQLLGGFLIFRGAEMKRLADLIKYLEPHLVAVLSLVHFVAALLAALAASHMLRNKVFPFLPKGYDVDLSELEESAKKCR